jgi:hypothetical protein
VLCAHCGDRIGVYEPALWVDRIGDATPAEPDEDAPASREALHRHHYEKVYG